MTGTPAPDTLSDWTLPPLAAREAGDTAPIRCFASAEEALRFLAGRWSPARKEAGRRNRLPGDGRAVELDHRRIRRKRLTESVLTVDPASA